MMAKKIIYFLCTGNSCRSQMAEGWAKKYLDDKWEVHSAGIEAHGLNKRAIKVMKEVDVDISKQTSNIINFDILNQTRSEEHTSELQSRGHLVCRLLLEKQKNAED